MIELVWESQNPYSLQNQNAKVCVMLVKGTADPPSDQLRRVCASAKLALATGGARLA
jgi:hypothetical protein